MILSSRPALRYPKLPIWTPLTVLVMTSTALFAVTLWVGVWAAYDLATALLRCAVLVTSLGLMLGIAWAGRYHAKTTLGLAGVGCALGAGVLSLAYGLHFTYNSGATASGLMVLLPLGASGVWWQWLSHQKRLTWVAGSALLLALLIFVLTLERTAWLGLASGLLGAGYVYWRFAGSISSTRVVHRVSDWLLVLLLVSGLIGYALLGFTPTADRLLSHSAIGSALQERTALWRESVALGRDYYFTGSGLGMTAMVYSTYVLAVHVPYWYHAHQLYLQISLEQGLPGLVAFLGMILPLLGILVITYRASTTYARWFCLAAITALLAVVTYGFLDAELYATSMVVVLFVPLGFGLALYWALLNRQAAAGLAPTRRSSFLMIGAGLLPLIVLLVLSIRPAAKATLYTNLGVLHQTKSELALYHWSTWPIQDELRRRGLVDLSAARVYYQAVLTLDPANATVHQRLGQVALSQGDYAVALAHLRQAYATEPTRASLRRLLGEAYAVTGDITKAATLWQSVNMPQGQIDDRLWWYDSLQAEQEVRWLQQALARRQL